MIFGNIRRRVGHPMPMMVESLTYEGTSFIARSTRNDMESNSRLLIRGV